MKEHFRQHLEIRNFSDHKYYFSIEIPSSMGDNYISLHKHIRDMLDMLEKASMLETKPVDAPINLKCIWTKTASI